MKLDLKMIIDSLDEIQRKDTVDIESNETINVSRALNLLSRMKVDPLRSSLLGGIQKTQSNDDFITQRQKKTLFVVCHKPDYWRKDHPKCR